MSAVDVVVTIQPTGRRSERQREYLPRIPRIARLMALAIKFEDMVDSGKVRDYADLAKLGYVTSYFPAMCWAVAPGSQRMKSSR
jgi:hypothetical protein